MANPHKIYAETSVIGPNLAQESDEQGAMGILRRAHADGTVSIVEQSSRVALREVEATTDPAKRVALKTDYDNLKSVPRDERVLEFQPGSNSPGSGAVGPLVQDVQDAALYERLTTLRLSKADAQHLAQAISNGCDYFLTRDRKTIIDRVASARKLGRFPWPILLMTPSQLVRHLGLQT